jgi:hypothetical protein
MSFQGFSYLGNNVFRRKIVLAFIGQWPGAAKLAVNAIPVAGFQWNRVNSQ